MKKLIAILSSLIFVSLGITACSKDSSKKQPNFRNRNKPVATQSGERQRPEQVDPLNPTSGRTQTDGTPSSKPEEMTIPPASRKGAKGEVCQLQTDDIQDLAKPCNTVRVALVDGEVTPLAFEGGFYEQHKEVEMTPEKQDDGSIIAKLESNQPIVKRNLKILQIMKDDTKLDIPAEMQFQAEVIKSDEDLNGSPDAIAGLRDDLNKLKVNNGDHLLIVTNIEALKDDPTQTTEHNANIRNDFLSNNTGIQSDLKIADASKLDEAIAAEEAFLASHLAQLTYAIQLDEVDGMKVTKVTVNGEELLHDGYTQTQNTSINRMYIRILDLSVFKGPAYKVVVEIEKE